MAHTNFVISQPVVQNFKRPNGSGSTNTNREGRYTAQTVSGVKRRKPKGWMVPTDYSLDYVDIQYQQGRCINAPLGMNSSSGQVYTGVVGPGDASVRFSGDSHFDLTVSTPGLTDDLGLRNQALIRARNNLKTSDINLGVAFAERKRTAQLVGDTTFQLARSYRDLRRGNIRAAMNRLGITSKAREPRGSNAPNKWLELQYGWKPLLSDVYGACDALSKRDKEDWRVTAKGRVSRQDTYSRVYDIAFNGPFDGCNCVAVAYRGAYVRIDALPENEAIISLASLGITNPLLIGWELVPFSFVVDWFLPIGGYLESLDAMLGYGDAYTSTSYIVRCEWLDAYSKRIQSGNYIMDNQYFGKKQFVHLRRTAQSGVPMPKFPRIKDPISLGHMANGLALLAQVFGRR